MYVRGALLVSLWLHVAIWTYHSGEGRFSPHHPSVTPHSPPRRGFCAPMKGNMTELNNVALTELVGTWHEIAKFPITFEGLFTACTYVEFFLPGNLTGAAHENERERTQRLLVRKTGSDGFQFYSLWGQMWQTSPPSGHIRMRLV